MKAALTLGGLCAAFALSACTTNGGALDEARFNSPDFGASVRSNIAAESLPVDPAAVNSPIMADGARQELAQSRYRTDRVKQPPDTSTSSVGTASNPASSAGGSSGGTTPN